MMDNLDFRPSAQHILSLPARAHGAAIAALALLVLGGCQDAPTMPEPVQQIAGGEAWVAIPAPGSLPTLDTWMPYVDGSGAEAQRAVSTIRALEAESRRARGAGRLERAAELDHRAVRMAVLSLQRPVEPRVVFDGLHALDVWADRVEAGVDLRVYPDVAESLELVRHSRAAARTALELGDTTAAALRIAEAAEVIRSHTPMTVALRVLGRAEARLQEREVQSRSVDRAIHLIRSARLELVSGDPSRALRRALYALQLIEGKQVAEISDLLKH